MDKLIPAIAILVLLSILAYVIYETFSFVRKWGAKIQLRKDMVEIRKELTTLTREERNSNIGIDLSNKLKSLYQKYIESV